MRFSVLTYNVLHSFGATRLLRGRAPGTWAHDRLQRVAELVSSLAPDVACLQEVDAKAHEELARALGDDFVCAAEMRNDQLPPKDGIAIFVRKSRFEVVSVHQSRLRDTLVHHVPDYETIRGRAFGMAAAFWRELQEKLNMSLVVRLREAPGHDSSNQEVVIGNSHLFWDPKYPDLKLLQAFLYSREVVRLGAGAPLILTGDLNSVPELPDGNMSGVYELLSKGVVHPLHLHHPVMLRRAVGILKGVTKADVPELTTVPFRSAYRDVFGMDGPITNLSRDFRGCLDYIFYNGKPQLSGIVGTDVGPSSERAQLQLIGARPLPSVEMLRGAMFPSAEHPSDHLPLLAHFDLVTAPAE